MQAIAADCSRLPSKGSGGWKVGLMGVAVSLLAGFLLARTESLPSPEGRRGGPRVSWGGDGGGLAERMVGEPTVFALGSAAGFTHGWLGETPRALPPTGAGTRGGEASAAGVPGGAAWRPDWAKGEVGDGPRVPPGRPAGRGPVAVGNAASGTTTGQAEGTPGGTAAAKAQAELEFGGEWTPRLFGGVDLDFGGWTTAGWTAEAEVSFDARGVPERVFLTERSGLDEVDRRLAREPWKWRLRDDGAERSGRARWRSPAREGGTP